MKFRYRMMVPILAAAMLAAASGASQAQSEFKVGFVLSQIGPLAELAKTYLDGA